MALKNTCALSVYVFQDGSRALWRPTKSGGYQVKLFKVELLIPSLNGERVEQFLVDRGPASECQSRHLLKNLKKDFLKGW
jgi:hypothetical protein